ncbi:MAG: RDD family protein [Erysipelotrichaceae bacterium]
MKTKFIDKVLTNETKQNLYWAKAPIYKRVLAFFIDLFIMFPIQNITRSIHPILPAIALYFIILESSAWQGTIGKRVLGMKVERIDGSRISIIQASLRYVVKVFTLAIIGVGYWPLFKNKQAICDRLIESDVYALTLKKGVK